MTEYPREVQQLIGRLVKLTSDKDPNIADVAFDLLRRWDQDRSTNEPLGLSEEDRQRLYEE